MMMYQVNQGEYYRSRLARSYIFWARLGKILFFGQDWARPYIFWARLSKTVYFLGKIEQDQIFFGQDWARSYHLTLTIYILIYIIQKIIYRDMHTWYSTCHIHVELHTLYTCMYVATVYPAYMYVHHTSTQYFFILWSND